LKPGIQTPGAAGQAC